MSNDNMFETATRTKLRFQSTRGDLSVEQLWDVPLRSRDDFNLDTVAKTANRTTKTIGEESFVETTKLSVAHARAQLALDIVKHVIQTKLGEEALAKKHADNKLEKEKLLRILAEKQEGRLSALSEKELLRRISELEE